VFLDLAEAGLALVFLATLTDKIVLPQDACDRLMAGPQVEDELQAFGPHEGIALAQLDDAPFVGRRGLVGAGQRGRA
jgi:hypothetical protein